jgi:hypothetical protein
MRYEVVLLPFLLKACGGATGGSAGDPGGHSQGDGGSSGGGNDSGGNGDVVQPSDCSLTNQGASCANEGEQCWVNPGPCPDPCESCVYLKCESGSWTYGTTSPTKSCGPDGSVPCGDVGCDPTTQFCEVSMLTGGSANSYSCHTLPTDCASNPTCSCIPESAECACTASQGSFLVTCPPL